MVGLHGSLVWARMFLHLQELCLSFWVLLLELWALKTSFISRQDCFIFHSQSNCNFSSYLPTPHPPQTTHKFLWLPMTDKLISGLLTFPNWNFPFWKGLKRLRLWWMFPARKRLTFCCMSQCDLCLSEQKLSFSVLSGIHCHDDTYF